MNCPNCGSDKHKDVAEESLWCCDCGTLWTMRPKLCDIIDIPTRSRPAEVLELPDENGYWWKEQYGQWILTRVRVAMESYVIEWPGNDRCDHELTPGRYIRAVPPIIAPAKPEPDPDAEWLRMIPNLDRWSLKDIERMKSIADDLERLRREAKEAT